MPCTETTHGNIILTSNLLILSGFHAPKEVFEWNEATKKRFPKVRSAFVIEGKVKSKIKGNERETEKNMEKRRRGVRVSEKRKRQKERPTDTHITRDKETHVKITRGGKRLAGADRGTCDGGCESCGRKVAMCTASQAACRAITLTDGRLPSFFHFYFCRYQLNKKSIKVSPW